MKYTFSSYNEIVKAHYQGKLNAIIYGPAGRDEDARMLATYMAHGLSRKKAAEKIETTHCLDARGLRVVGDPWFCR